MRREQTERERERRVSERREKEGEESETSKERRHKIINARSSETKSKLLLKVGIYSSTER